MSSTFDVSSIDTKYPKLSFLLKKYDVKVKIFEAYKDRTDELLKAETLINDIERLGCKGLENKFNDVGDADKFDSTVSELRVAKILLNNEYDVELLSDSNQLFITKSPDILCMDDASTTYIEVVKLNANIDITNLIQEEIGDYVKCLPYQVNVYLSEKLSMPEVTQNGQRKKLNRSEQRDLVLESLAIFKESFSKIEEKDVLSDTTISTPDIDFKLTKVNLEQGYIGFILSDCTDVPPELLEYFEQRCIDDKNKGSAFPLSERDKSFVIAIDLDMRIIKYDSIRRLLYGNIALNSRLSTKYWESVIAEIHNRDSWEKIERAKGNGWESFLREQFLIPNNETLHCISENNEGKFVSGEMDDISGVLLIDYERNCFFYPNPFCRDEINNPEILNFINMTENVDVNKK